MEAVGILELALDQWVQIAVPQWTEAKQRMLASRLGWRGERISLQEVGTALGITRQSAAEAEKLIRRRLEFTADSAPPTITDAMDLVSSLQPARLDRTQQNLRDAGFIGGKMTVPGLLIAADLSGAHHELCTSVGYVHHCGSEPPPVKTVLATVRKICRAVGVCSVTSVLTDLDWADRWDPIDLERDLADAGVAETIGFPWVAAPRGHVRKTAVSSVARRMLAVVDPVRTADIEIAVRRRVRAGRMPFAPPSHTLEAYLRHRPDFAVDSKGVHSIHPLRPEAELSKTDLFLYRHFLSTDTPAQTRGALQKAADAAGISSYAVDFALATSPILSHVGRNRWTLVGRGEERSNSSSLRGSATAASFEWGPEGHLVLRAILTSESTDRIPVPQPVLAFLVPGKYAVVEPPTNLVLNVGSGFVDGFRAAVSGRGVAGDTVVAEFDLSSRTCALTVKERQT